MADLLLDGLPLPAPDGVFLSLIPLSGCDRALDGTLVTDFRPFKRRVTLRWAALSPARERTLRAAFSRPGFLSLALPGGYGEESEAFSCCLTGYEMSFGPSPAGAPLAALDVSACLTEK